MLGSFRANTASHFVLVFFALGFLAACADDAPPPAVKPASTGCPQVAVIRDLSIYQNPPAANENDMVISVRMGNIKGGCAVDEKGSAIDASFDVVALRGSGTLGHNMEIPFFISVLDAQDNVVRKETYEVPVHFEGEGRMVKGTIPVNPTVALPVGADGADYRVLIGFQLSPEQVNANHRFFEQMPTVPAPANRK